MQPVVVELESYNQTLTPQVNMLLNRVGKQAWIVYIYVINIRVEYLFESGV